MKSLQKFLSKPMLKSSSRKWSHLCQSPELGVRVEVVVDPSSKIDDTDFPEFDPTPYDGGYDITETYGKPLEPSDAICYPRSNWNPDSSELDVFSYGSVVAPYGRDPVRNDAEKPQDTGVVMQSALEEKILNGNALLPVDSNTPQKASAFANGHEGEKASHDDEGICSSNCVPSFDYDFWGFDLFSYENGFGNASGDVDDYGKAIVPYQGEGESTGYGYGMEESQDEHQHDFYSNWSQPHEDFFDGWLWPNGGELCSHNPDDVGKSGHGNQWNETADYLFGFSNPYGEVISGNHNSGYPICGYEKHSFAEPHHLFVEYQEPHYEKAFYNETDYDDYSYADGYACEEGGMHF